MFDCQEEQVGEQLFVVALGGNAISPPGSAGPIPAQYEATMATAHHLAHCVADLQGGMGFMLQQCLDNAFHQAGVRRPTVTVVTPTVVDAADPAFATPSKPVGTFYDEAEARRRIKGHGWVMREDAGRGWRRDLHELDAATLERHAADGQFAPGSMLPKVQAVLRFLAQGGRRAVICTPELSQKALAGEIGTQVAP